jgi:hypothetical protein
MSGNETSAPTWRRTSMDRGKPTVSVCTQLAARHFRMVERVQREVKFVPVVNSLAGRVLHLEIVISPDSCRPVCAIGDLLQPRFTVTTRR